MMDRSSSSSRPKDLRASSASPVGVLFERWQRSVTTRSEAGRVAGGERIAGRIFFAAIAVFESAYRRSKYFVKPAIKTPPVATGYMYTVQEIANAVKVSPAFIYREIKRGNLTAIRHNSRILRIPVEAFKEWQDACLTTANRCQLIAR
jgi:excisionase family DNA binding protein